MARGKTRLIAIVGASGAGKSWLTSRLQARLGQDAIRICQDDFYLDRSHLSLRRRATLNFDHPRAIDWKGLEGVLEQCAASRAFELPRYDFVTHARVGSERCKPAPVVLVEGLWLLRRPSIRDRFFLKIFVQCEEEVCLARRVARDTAERGRSETSVRKQFAEQVTPMSRAYVLPQMRWADVIVRSPLSDGVVERLARAICALMSEERNGAANALTRVGGV
jgi:uridine kinase